MPQIGSYILSRIVKLRSDWTCGSWYESGIDCAESGRRVGAVPITQ